MTKQLMRRSTISLRWRPFQKWSWILISQNHLQRSRILTFVKLRTPCISQTGKSFLRRWQICRLAKFDFTPTMIHQAQWRTARPSRPRTVTSQMMNLWRVTLLLKLVDLILQWATSHATNSGLKIQWLRLRPRKFCRKPPKSLNLLAQSSRLKMGGKRKRRPSCADSGSTARSVKMIRKNSHVTSLIAKKNSKRKRVSADSTLHQYASISWITLRSAYTDWDASSSTLVLTCVSARTILTWSRTTRDTQLWDFSRILRAAKSFTLTRTLALPLDSLLSETSAIVQRIVKKTSKILLTRLEI